jgi:hypothetical protein
MQPPFRKDGRLLFTPVQSLSMRNAAMNDIKKTGFDITKAMR